MPKPLEERERLSLIDRSLYYRKQAHRFADDARRWRFLSRISLLLIIPASGLGMFFAVLCMQALSHFKGSGFSASESLALGACAGVCASVWTHSSLVSVTLVRRLIEKCVERFGKGVE